MRRVLCAIILLLVSANASLADYNKSKDWFYEQEWRDRIRIQFLLVFTGDYSLQVDGAFGKGTYRALTSFQKNREFFPNGVLNDEEMQILRRDGLDLVKRVGFVTLNEVTTGLTLGVPEKLFNPPSTTLRGHQWRTYDDTIKLETLRVLDEKTSYKDLYQRLSSSEGGRVVTQKQFRNDYFIVSGTLDGKKFYLRFLKTQRDSRGFSLSWAPKHSVFMDRVAVAMSNSMTVFDGVKGDKLDAVTSAHRLRSNSSKQSQSIQNDRTPKTTDSISLSSGTGYFVSPYGHIGTNAHVVKSCKSIDVLGHGPATLIKADEESDLAILQLQTKRADHFAAFRAERPIARGEEIFVLGYPFAQILDNNLNFTHGIVSSLAGVKGDQRQFMVSAPVQPGNSGGPVLDRSGALVGTVVSRLDKFKTLRLAGDLPENINFAVRGSMMSSFMQSIGLEPTFRNSEEIKSPIEIDKEAERYTVLILCPES